MAFSIHPPSQNRFAKSHGKYSEEDLDIEISHREPVTFSDKTAFFAVKCVRLVFDTGERGRTSYSRNIVLHALSRMGRRSFTDRRPPPNSSLFSLRFSYIMEFRIGHQREDPQPCNLPGDHCRDPRYGRRHHSREPFLPARASCLLCTL